MKKFLRNLFLMLFAYSSSSAFARGEDFTYVYVRPTTKVFCLNVRAVAVANYYGLRIEAIEGEVDAYRLLGAGEEIFGHARYVDGFCEITVR